MAEETASAPSDADEFAAIPRPRYGRNPVVALVSIGLALSILWPLRGQLAYSLAPRTRAEVTAQALVAPGATPPLDRFVRLAGVGERASSVLIDTMGSHKFRHAFPIAGTELGVWVVRRMGDTRLADAQAEAYTGRLQAFDALSFAGTLRTSYAAPEARAIPLDPGRPVLPAGTSRVVVTVGCPGGRPRVPLAEIEARLSAHDLALCEGASAPLETTTLEVAKGDPIAALASKTNVIRAVAFAPARIPPRALVLVEGEDPSELWYVPVLYALLGLFVLFNGYLLSLRLRRR